MSSVLSISTKVTAGCPIDEATAEVCALATKLGIWVHFEFNGVDCNAAPHSDPKELAISQQRAQDSNTRYPMAFAHTQEPNPDALFPSEWHASHSMRPSREGKTFRAVCDRCGWTDFDDYSKSLLMRECTVAKGDVRGGTNPQE